MSIQPHHLLPCSGRLKRNRPFAHPAAAARTVARLVTGALMLAAGIAVADPDALLMPSGQVRLPPVDYMDYPHPVNLNDTGRVWQVAAWNNVLYAASDTGLQVWDYGDPAAPVLVGTLLPGRMVQSLRIRGDLVYACDSIGRFHIYDLASGTPLPASLCDVAMFPAVGSTHDIAFSGSIVYVVENSGGIYVIDCANPRAPVLRGHQAVSSCHHDALATEGNLAALAQCGDLFLVNIANPASPVIGPRIVTPGNVNAVVLRNGLAYVADYHRGFFIMDVSNPAQPVEISRFERPGFYAQNLLLEGDLLICGNGWEGFVVCDVSDPVKPRLVTAYGCGLAPLDMITMGDHLVTAGMFGLHTFALANRSGVPRQAAGPSRADPWDMVVSRRRAFVGGWRGIHELDLSRNGPPVVRDSLATGSDITWGLAVEDEHLYATVDHQGLLVYRLSPNARPIQVGSLPLGGRYVFQELDVSGDVAVIAAWSWVIFVDVSDPAVPRLLGGLDLQQVTTGVEINGSLVYVAAGYGGLVVIDFTDPAHPTVIWSDVTGDRTTGVAWRAPYLYVGSAEGFRVYDGTNPRQPSRLGYLDLPVECGQPVLSGRVAYVPTKRQGLQLISVADPANPKVLGGHDLLKPACFAAVANDQVYVAGGDSLFVYPVHRGRGVSATPPQLTASQSRGGAELSWDIPPEVESERFRVLAFTNRPAREIPFTVISSADQQTARARDPNCGVGSTMSYVLQARTDDGDWLELDRVDFGNTTQPARVLSISVSPNPANPRAQVDLELRDGGVTRVEIFDLAGRRVRCLLDGPLPAGRTRLDWDGRDDDGRLTASGMYFCRGATAGEAATIRLQLVR